MRILFLCSMNKLRSPTAENVFASRGGLFVDSAGLDNDAVQRVSVEQINDADIIFVMENTHKRKLTKKFNEAKGKKIVVLGIPDEYDYMQAELVELLKIKVSPHLRGH